VRKYDGDGVLPGSLETPEAGAAAAVMAAEAAASLAASLEVDP